MIKSIIKKQCSPGDYFILSVKGQNIPWKDIPFKYRNEKTLEKQLEQFYIDYPATDYDLYFCPVTYSVPKRKKDKVNDIKFLWQDIDENSDPKSIEPKPTYMWESSPNKYQGIWELDRYIDKDKAELINKALSETIGADKCHDIGHVLRIPGSINHKYKDKPEVAQPIYTKEIYRYPKLFKDLGLKDIKDKKKESKESSSDASNSSSSASKLLEKYNITGKVFDLLTATEAEAGRRSDTIWYLENKLFEKGLEIPEIITLIKNSVWNKYRGREDEMDRLRKEAEKILLKDLDDGGSLSRVKKKKKEFSIENYGKVMSNLNTAPGWLVEGWWGRRSHGLVAGQPKVFKSTYVHDLAVSVASGKPFLGKYKVNESGPVLMVQNENVDWLIKDRTEKIIAHRGLVGEAKIKSSSVVSIKWAPEIPLYFINQQGFQLDNEDHQRQIEEIIKEIKPVLVIFDPLYLMFSGNLNAADELNPILNWMLDLKNKYKTGIMVIHHYNKSTEANRGGQKMLGSVVLHGWVESAWYIRRKDQQEVDETADEFSENNKPTSVIIDREFRTAGSFPELELKIRMGQYQDIYYDVEVEVFKGEAAGKGVDDETKDELIKDYLVQVIKAAAYPLNKKELVTQFYNVYPKGGISQRKIKDAIDQLSTSGDISFLPGKGYYIK